MVTVRGAALESSANWAMSVHGICRPGLLARDTRTEPIVGPARTGAARESSRWPTSPVQAPPRSEQFGRGRDDLRDRRNDRWHCGALIRFVLEVPQGWGDCNEILSRFENPSRQDKSGRATAPS